MFSKLFDNNVYKFTLKISNIIGEHIGSNITMTDVDNPILIRNEYRIFKLSHVESNVSVIVTGAYAVSPLNTQKSLSYIPDDHDGTLTQIRIKVLDPRDRIRGLPDTLEITLRERIESFGYKSILVTRPEIYLIFGKLPTDEILISNAKDNNDLEKIIDELLTPEDNERILSTLKLLDI